MPIAYLIRKAQAVCALAPTLFSLSALESAYVASAWGQGPVPVPSVSRLPADTRLRIVTIDQERYEGRLGSLRGDTLTLHDWHGTAVMGRSARSLITFDLSELRSIDYRVGSRAVAGVLTGAAVGAGLSLLLGVTLHPVAESTTGAYAATAGAVLIPVGGLIGLLAGIQTPAWKPIRAP